MQKALIETVAVMGFLIGWTSAGYGAVTIDEGAYNSIASTVARNAVNEPMLQMTVDNPAGQPNAEVTAVTVTAGAIGTGNDLTDLAAGGVTLYWDKNRDGKLTLGGGTPDTLLGSGNFSADNGTCAISGFAAAVAGGAEIDLLVLYTFSAGATTGESFRARVVNNTNVSVRNATTLAPITVNGAPVDGFLRTVGSGKITVTRVVQDPDGAIAIPNRTLLPLAHLLLTADNVEDVQINSVDFIETGTAHGVNGIVPNTVRLFQQTAEPDDSGLADDSGSFPSDGGRITLSPASAVIVPRGGQKHIWVTVDVVSLALGVLGSKYRVQLPSATPMSAVGVTSTDGCTVVGAPVNGPEWEFNYNPVTLALANDLGAVLMASTALDFPVMSFQVKNDPEAKSEACEITEFTFTASGTMNDATALSQVELFRDLAPLGKITAADTLLGGGVFNADNGSVTINFSATPVTLGVNATQRFIVGYDLNGSAVDGQTARISILSADDIQVIGETSAVNSSMSPEPLQGSLKTVGRPRAQFTCVTGESVTPSIIPPEAVGFPVFSFKIKALNDEDLIFEGIRIDLTGPTNEIPYFTNFELFKDSNGNGKVDAGETQLGPDILPTPMGGDAQLIFDIPLIDQPLIARNATVQYTVYADIAASVVGDGTETFTVTVGDEDDVFLFGALSAGAADFTAAPPPCSTDRMIRNPAISISKYPSATPSEILGCINGSYGMIGATFFVPSGENIILQSVGFSVDGTLQDNIYVDQAFAWDDKNKNFYVNTGEDELGFLVSPLSVDNGSATFPLAGTAEKNKTFNLSLGLDFDATTPADAVAQLGKNVTAYQIGSPIITGIGAISGRPVEVSNPPGDDQGRTLTFDKGSLSVKLDTIPVLVTPPNATTVEAFAIYLKTGAIEDVYIDRLRLTPSGTINEAVHFRPTDAIKVYMDRNKDGIKNSGDYLIATVDRPATDNGVIDLDPADFNFYGPYVYSYPVIGSPYDQFLITVDLLASAPEGSTIQFQLQSSSDLEASGGCSLYEYADGTDITYAGGVNPPLVGPAIVVERGAVDLRTTAAFKDDADNKPNVVMAPQAQGYEVLRINAKSTSVEPVQLNGITLHSTGTAREVLDLDPIPVHLYKGGIVPANLLASGTFSADNGTVNLTGFAQTVILHSTGTLELRVAFDGSGAGVLGTDFNISVTGADLQATGVVSGLPVNEVGPDDPYTGIPIVFGKGRLTVRADGADADILPIPLSGDTQIQKLKFTATRTEGIQIDQLEVHAAGSANEATALENGAVKFVLRSGGTPQTVAVAPFLPGDNGLADLTNLDVVIAAGTDSGTKYSLDALLYAPGTVVGTTLRFDVDTTLSVTALGQVTGLPPDLLLSDFAGGDSIASAPTISGRVISFSTGKVTLSKGANNPSNGSILGNEALVPLMQVKAAVASSLEGVTLTEIRICASGTVNETVAIGNVYLYNDVNGDGDVTGTDVLLDTATFAANDGAAVFSGLNLTYPAGATVNWLIAAQLTNGGLNGETIRVAMCSPPAISGVGQLTDEEINVVVGGTAPAGAILTIVHPTPSPTPSPTGTPSPSPTPIAGIVINEIHADPHATLGNANGDGIVGPGDEFVELVNTSPYTVNLSGCKIKDSSIIRHTFPAGTLLPPGCAVVVFGGGNPTGAFGGSLVQEASTGSLNLSSGSSSGDTVSFNDPSNSPLVTYIYGSEGNADQSLTRSPDLTGADPLIQHIGAPGSGSARFSPGTRIDGTVFSAGVCVITPTPSPTVSPTPSPSPTPFNNAVLVSHNIPAQIPQGYAVPVQIRMRNTGDITWTAAANHSLAVITDACDLTPAARLVLPPAVGIETGEEHVFMVDLTGAPGTCLIEFRMVQEFVEFFGPTVGATPSIVAPVNNATTQGDTIPALLGPGHAVTGGFLFTNTGNTTWYSVNGFNLLVKNDSCGLFPDGVIAIPGDGPVAPGQSYFFPAGVTAPPDPGICALTLQMQEVGNAPFGAELLAEFEVHPDLNDVGDWTAYE